MSWHVCKDWLDPAGRCRFCGRQVDANLVEVIRSLWPLRHDPFKRYMLKSFIKYERIRRDREGF